jgi:hypothetical protein
MSNDIDDLELMARELKERLARRSPAPGRWNANPEDVRRSVMQLVLTLVELIHQLLERQALRRMSEGTLTPDEIERVGQALMQLEATIKELAEQNGLELKDLNLDLGPLGKLL